MKARGHLDVRYLGSEEDPAALVALDSVEGDLIVTLGAGDIFKVGEAVLKILSREPAVYGQA
jgi:UDP-N-acetylmuramate-alanine ligase